jgi:hypothetical protein
MTGRAADAPSPLAEECGDRAADGRPAADEPGVSALAALLQAGDIAITKRDPASEEVDVSPE